MITLVSARSRADLTSSYNRTGATRVLRASTQRACTYIALSPHTDRCMLRAMQSRAPRLHARCSKHLALHTVEGDGAHSPPRCTRLQAPRGRERPTPRSDARTRNSFTMNRCGTPGSRPTRALPRSSFSKNSRSSVSVAAPGCCRRSTCEYAVEIDAGVDVLHVTLSQAAHVNALAHTATGVQDHASMVGHGCEVEWVARVSWQGSPRIAEHIQCSRGSVV